MIKLLIAVLCIAGLLWAFRSGPLPAPEPTSWPYKANVIFTCTTFFDFAKGDKWTSFCRAMDSIQEQHSPETLAHIKRWVVVNEWSENPTKDWAAAMKERYPFVDFIQKGPTEKGQAASMNILLETIRPYEFWIHWEESWYCRREVLGRAILAMQQNKDITQLQFTQLGATPSWLDVESNRIRCDGDICRIAPSARVHEFLDRDAHDVAGEFFTHWPLYSLLPSINRVPFYRIGEFSTDPTLWPLKFEWDYARRWLRAGAVKAVLRDGPVVRKASHVSTYA